MTWVINIAAVFLAFAAMEAVAWCTHRFIMHGLLWRLHRDHHQKDHDHAIERNDAFFLLFAVPAIVLFAFGARAGIADVRIWIALGITLYGLAYFLVHDVFIHQRIGLASPKASRRRSWLKRTDNRYFRALRKAHKMHHKHLGKEQGECFGMLLVPWKYLKEARTAEVEAAA